MCSACDDILSELEKLIIQIGKMKNCCNCKYETAPIDFCVACSRSLGKEPNPRPHSVDRWSMNDDL